MIAAELITPASARLAAAGIESAKVDARLLYQAARELGGTEEQITARYHDWIERRASREPLQLIIGRVTFHSIEIKVAAGVFIPRPETEWLADQAINLLGADNRVVFDLCAGTGALGLLIAAKFPKTRVFGLEISEPAVALASENAATLGLENYRCLQGDVRAADSLEKLLNLAGCQAQMVVSNPPYLVEAVTQIEAQADPGLALYGGGVAGMELPGATIRAAAKLCAKDAWLLLEHDAAQGEATRALASRAGFRQAKTLKDLSGHDRYLHARR